MTTSAHFATEIYRQQEAEVVRRLERRRVQAERLQHAPAGVEAHRGILSAIGVRITRLQSLVRRPAVHSGPVQADC
ncbi:MAG: hypothetical protein ACXWDA_03300 [Aeromicrobium sp.]